MIWRFNSLLKVISNLIDMMKKQMRIFRGTDRSCESKFSERRSPPPGHGLPAPLCWWHKVTVVPSLAAAQILQRSKRGLHPRNWASIHVSGTEVLLFRCLRGFPVPTHQKATQPNQSCIWLPQQSRQSRPCPWSCTWSIARLCWWKGVEKESQA